MNGIRLFRASLTLYTRTRRVDTSHTKTGTGNPVPQPNTAAKHGSNVPQPRIATCHRNKTDTRDTLTPSR